MRALSKIYHKWRTVRGPISKLSASTCRTFTRWIMDETEHLAVSLLLGAEGDIAAVCFAAPSRRQCGLDVSGKES